MTASFDDLFSVQIFFIILRETLETAIIISVLLSFINQRLVISKDQNSTISNPEHESSSLLNDPPPPLTSASQNSRFESEQKSMRLQVWVGALLGLVICALIGIAFIMCFRILGKDYWSYAERLWEGIFSILSSAIITIMGVGLLRINKIMKVKWWIKLGDAYNEQAPIEQVGASSDQLLLPSEPDRMPQKLTKRYFLAILPLVTTLREGLEAVVFVGGIGMSLPTSSIPLSIVAGVLLGSVAGYLLYRGGNKLLLQYFLICSTCFLYLVSAGLMSRGVWFLELEQFVRRCGGQDPSEAGSGPGSYDILRSVWHVNCCNGLTDGWWMVFNAILGWTNSATYLSVALYIGYWILVSAWLEARLYEEREGVLPFIPIKWQIKRLREKVKFYQSQLNHLGMLDYNQNQQINKFDDLPATPLLSSLG